MPYVEFQPDPSLTGLVDCYWRISGERLAVAPDAGQVLPDGCVEIVFCSSGCVQPSGELSRLTQFIIGTSKQRTDLTYAGDIELIGARLRSASASALLGIPALEITGMVLELDQLSTRLHDQFKPATDSSI